MKNRLQNYGQGTIEEQEEDEVPTPGIGPEHQQRLQKRDPAANFVAGKFVDGSPGDTSFNVPETEESKVSMSDFANKMIQRNSIQDLNV